MKKEIVVLLLLISLIPAVYSAPNRSLLDDDPKVIYLEEHVEKPVELLVIKAAQVFSDKEGKRPLGNLVKDQKVILQAMTDRAYRVSAQTGGNKVTGWVAPWAFASKDPKFVGNLKKLYTRQLEVVALIKEGRPAIGMTVDEILCEPYSGAAFPGFEDIIWLMVAVIWLPAFSTRPSPPM